MKKVESRCPKEYSGSVNHVYVCVLMNKYLQETSNSSCSGSRGYYSSNSGVRFWALLLLSEMAFPYSTDASCIKFLLVAKHSKAVS